MKKKIITVLFFAGIVSSFGLGPIKLVWPGLVFGIALIIAFHFSNLEFFARLNKKFVFVVLSIASYVIAWVAGVLIGAFSFQSNTLFWLPMAGYAISGAVGALTLLLALSMVGLKWKLNDYKKLILLGLILGAAGGIISIVLVGYGIFAFVPLYIIWQVGIGWGIISVLTRERTLSLKNEQHV